MADYYRPELSALDPGKQGLKPAKLGSKWFNQHLSALDPGKQGLKPDGDAVHGAGFRAFSA